MYHVDVRCTQDVVSSNLTNANKNKFIEKYLSISPQIFQFSEQLFLRFSLLKHFFNYCGHFKNKKWSIPLVSQAIFELWLHRQNNDSFLFKYRLYKSI